VAAPDLPGFGGSESAGEVMTMGAAADRALAALDDAAIEGAVVCGLSIGGYVAFEVWRRARERVRGLVLANTRAVADSEEAASGRRALAERLLREGNVVAAEPPPLLSPDAPADVRERVSGWIADQPPASIAAALRGMAERPDSSPDLPTIDVPTLVVTSSQDGLIAPEISVEMASHIPGAGVEVIEGAGHLSNLEAAEAFNAALLGHLEACGLG
jgi:pimeloyl-ACP methyl ester carboxylesterase